ncbi:unnamed protein product [marine sediment metagenome]|uniref:Uncharacterized protein n=1 Tax=marine sediment metagenome TaxID=412755 RepID=X1P0X1_9ZZZZ
MWQIASDFITFLGWFFQNLGELIGSIFTPVKYVFTYVKSFFTTALSPPIPADEIWVFNAETVAVFDAIPYWSEIIVVLGIAIMIIFSFYIIKQFLHT